MNRLLRPIGFCVLLAGLLAPVAAPLARGQDGNDLGTLPVARPFQQGVGFPAPGRVWIGGNASHNGLGYQGSYFTGGMVANLGDDWLDGFWVLDSRAHISQQGNLLGNFGFVRGLTLDQLAADFRVGIFYDVDGDKADNFGHTFHQIGVTGEMLNDYFELRANGYFPIATPNFQLGTAENCFVGHNFLIQTGLDSALTGFDMRAGFRPAALQPWAGVIDAGGYYYRSDLVEPFGGFTGGFNVQPVSGINTIFQINHDDRFKTTGLLAVQVHFGGSRGRGASRYAREAEPVRRNDHIVRVHRDPIFGINPATNALWNVIHVDNSAAAGGDGTVERPFNTLAAAQAASVTNDMIFVREGLTPGGDLTGMDTGIVLKNGQFFLGDGVAHVVPTQIGGFQLCNDIDGIRPTITNPFGPAVALANDNTVGGFIIGNAGNPAAVGIQGIATNNAIIRDNLISNSLSDGIRITGGTGTMDFTRNTIVNSFADGIHVVNSSGTVNISDSTFLANGVGGLAGVHIDKTGGAPLTANIRTSTFDGNGTGILSSVTGVGAVLNTNITDNLTISNSLANGIDVISAGGAVHTAFIDGNLAIDGNGVGGAGGTGLVIRALDGGAATSFMTATVSNNSFNNNIGGGTIVGTHVLVDVAGNANTPLVLIDTNTFTGGPVAINNGPGLQFNYNVTGNALNNFVTMNGNTLTDITNDDGVTMLLQGASRVGAIISRNIVTNTDDDGFDLRVTGTAVGHFQFTQNVITGFGGGGVGGNGIQASVQGTLGPIMIVEAVDNIINNGGAFNSTAINLELGQFGGAPSPLTNADLFAFLRNNTLTPNAGLNDVTATIEATAVAASTICLQMTNNNAADGILLTNNSPVAGFGFENGGANIPAAPATAGAGTVTPVAAGTCAALAGPVAILPLLP